jgi:glycosyltransferase involved in cell wall biosynthesis
MLQPDLHIHDTNASIRRSLAKIIAPNSAHLETGNGFDGLPPSGELVSVVVPAYNHQDFIDEALLSITGQTYGQLELLIIDDYSTDKTYERALASLRGSNRPYCAIQRSRNVGLETNLNVGVQIAHGGWIAILASDDVFPRDSLARLMASAVREKADVAVGPVDEITKDGRFKSSRAAEVAHCATLPVNLLRKAILVDRRSLLLQGMLISRGVFASVGLFDPQIFASDFDYLIRMVSRGTRFTFVRNTTALHRATRKSLSRADIERHHLSARNVVRRHSRSLNELRQAIATLRFESGVGKLANGFLTRGLADLFMAFAISPIVTLKVVLTRIVHRVR